MVIARDVMIIIFRYKSSKNYRNYTSIQPYPTLHKFTLVNSNLNNNNNNISEDESVIIIEVTIRVVRRQ